MLGYQTRINIGGSIVREISETAKPIKQGMSLIHVLENGVAKVKESAAVAGTFAGIAFNQYKNTGRATAEEEFVATGTTYKLAHQADGGDVLLYDVAAGTSEAATMEADAQTIKSLTAGTKYKAVYAYVPSAIDVMASRTSLGEGIPGFNASDIVNAISVIVAGDIYTDYFDVTQDWTTVVPKAGANGMLSNNGSVIPSVYVVGLPSVNAPVLGIYFNV